MRLAAFARAVRGARSPACGGSSSSSTHAPTFAGVHDADDRRAGCPGSDSDLRSMRPAPGSQPRRTGRVSFARRRAHLYKQVPGGQSRRSSSWIGPYHVHERKRSGGARRSKRQALDEARHAAADREATELASLTSSHMSSHLPTSPTGVTAASAGGKETDGTFRFTGTRRPRTARATRAAQRS